MSRFAGMFASATAAADAVTQTYAAPTASLDVPVASRKSLGQILAESRGEVYVPVQTPRPRSWDVKSASGQARYLVSRNIEGVWRCECKDSLYRSRECKHIKQVKNENGF